MSTNNRNKKVWIYLLVIILMIGWVIISIIFFPPSRVSVFGFGIPSPMKECVFPQQKISISCPVTWNLQFTPQGNHGDLEVIAMIVVPWHSLPNVEIRSKPFVNDEISNVVLWGGSILIADPTYHEISLTDPGSDNLAVLVREYTLVGKSSQKSEIHCMDSYFVHNGMGYIFSFCAYQKDWDKVVETFSIMISSIKPTE